jgi:hypothetical protein
VKDNYFQEPTQVVYASPFYVVFIFRNQYEISIIGLLNDHKSAVPDV